MEYRIIATTGKQVNSIRLKADDYEDAMKKALEIWRKAGVLSQAEVHFTNIKCSIV